MTTPALKALLEKTAFTDSDLALLLTLQEPTECRALYDEAYKRTEAVLGNAVYMRGLIEVSNLCVYDCRYCGIRKSNHTLTRYMLTKEEILQAAERSFRAGYYSLALQSGERDDARFVEFIADVLRDLHALSLSMGIQDGCGLTLSFGEQSCETYEYWAKASGNRNALRYLLRLETSNPKLFETIHGHGPRRKTLIERYMALSDLRRTGYQVGTGVMIGIPGQSLEDLCRDIRTFQQFDVDMIGMGPYLMSEGGELQEYGQMEPKALLQLALNMIAVTRLVLGPVNIAAATALQAIRDDGRELGVSYGANVVMPNLSPQQYREGYQLYDNKPCINDEPTQCADCLEKRIASRGRKVGWFMMGSSRRFRERIGLTPREAVPEAAKKHDTTVLPAFTEDTGKRRIPIVARA